MKVYFVGRKATTALRAWPYMTKAEAVDNAYNYNPTGDDDTGPLDVFEVTITVSDLKKVDA